MEADIRKIKIALETMYDIPFHVEAGMEYNDHFYKVWPENDLDELFEVKILFKQNIRLVIEILPQRFSAGMIKDMNNADLNKRKIFLQYVQEFEKRNAKIEFYINQNQNSNNDNIWDTEWKHFKIRGTKIPISDSDVYNETEEACKWLSLSIGLVLSLLNVEKLEPEENVFLEGKINQCLINKYERNPVNRQLCLSANGYICKICGFDFEKTYGDIGHNFIHVHHIEMISEYGGEREIDPVSDLIPVCPNCHSMLHTKTPPITPDELKKVIGENVR